MKEKRNLQEKKKEKKKYLQGLISSSFATFNRLILFLSSSKDVVYIIFPSVVYPDAMLS